MVKACSLTAFLLLLSLLLPAQEIIYEHYGKLVDIWIVVPYNSLNFKKDASSAEYSFALQVYNHRKKQVGSFNKVVTIPRNDWLNDTGIPIKLSMELAPGSYDVQLQMKNKAMGDKRNLKRHFEIGDSSTEIGMSWVIAKREGTEFIPNTLANIRADSLAFVQKYSLQLDSLRINIDKQVLTITNPSSPIELDLTPYVSPDKENISKLTFFEGNIRYVVEPFVFSPWYSYSLRYPLDDQLAQLRYIATQNDWQVLRHLPKNKHAEAIEAFWKTLDPSPGTVRNETRESFYQRVMKADEQYTIHKKLKGWASDRGRIYIKYGEPDDISTNTYPLGRYPTIVWTYYKEDRQFVFADTKGYGQFTLWNKDEEY